MEIKIKCRPQDFVVEELCELQAGPSKLPYAVYKLTKTGWSTVELLKKISSDLKIPFSCFAYAGRKDKHAVTTQFISIKGAKPVAVKTKDYSMEFYGFSGRPIGPGMISANKFVLVVRDLDEAKIAMALKNIAEVKAGGFLNYFDDQRFGSYDAQAGFFGEKALKKHFNGALKAYMSSVYIEETHSEKARKQKIFDSWGDWHRCLDLAGSDFERRAFDYLIKNPKDFLTPLKNIPADEVSLFFSAYQSFIWNECLRRLVKEKAGARCAVYPGVCGDYIFFSGDDYLLKLSFPMPAAKSVMPDVLSQKVYDLILSEQGITRAMFNGLKIRTAFFKAHLRAAMVVPRDIVSQPGDDELYPGKQKITLSFSLPRGSYATMLLKRLFV